MELKTLFAQDAQGNVIPRAVATLYRAGTNTLATGLKDKAGANLSNPFTGGERGEIAFAAPDGDYDLKLSTVGRDYTMRLRFVDAVDFVAARDDVLGARDGAVLAAARAASAAGTAEALVGPVYASTAEGLAATSSGDWFAVGNDDGTFTNWLNDGGAAALPRTLATTDALALGAGAGLVGYRDGTVSGALDDALEYINHGGRKFRLVECVLRNTGDGWGVIDDATHKNMGVDSVEVDGYAVKVNYDFVAKRVVSAVASPDEVFSRAGIFCGASAGIYSSLIDVCAPFAGFIDDTGASPVVTTDDFWKATVSKTGALLTVSHAALGGGAAMQLTPYESRLSGAVAPGRLLVPTSVGSGSFVIGQQIPFAVVVGYSGSAWAITSGLLSSIHNLVSAAFVGSDLVITHPAVGGGQPVQATSMNASYRAVVTSVSSTETKVQFVDSAGVVASAANTNMKVALSFPATARSSSFLTGSRFAFNRGVCRILPENLASASGNIWFKALLEVD